MWNRSWKPETGPSTQATQIGSDSEPRSICCHPRLHLDSRSICPVDCDCPFDWTQKRVCSTFKSTSSSLFSPPHPTEQVAPNTDRGCFLTENAVFIQSFLFQFLSLANLTTKHITSNFSQSNKKQKQLASPINIIFRMKTRLWLLALWNIHKLFLKLWDPSVCHF